MSSLTSHFEDFLIIDLFHYIRNTNFFDQGVLNQLIIMIERIMERTVDYGHLSFSFQEVQYTLENLRGLYRFYYPLHSEQYRLRVCELLFECMHLSPMNMYGFILN